MDFVVSYNRPKENGSDNLLSQVMAFFVTSAAEAYGGRTWGRGSNVIKNSRKRGYP
ncbi:MAG: hypothetical protein GWN01_13335 [Nitrosopumilaceae archaeon]|nr:hypothetical protein [Nitrosopumilaceae archaeon]NIU88255.1 hypothetical protein [Nitrosopumilaceae archaeon]NIX62448.1 hypothetical protein [Nitrosopumilaceae archaeon]